MQLIIISGPSGSGKTTLSKKILKKLKNAIVINTDNYYNTGIISNILSKTISNYFDRKISFNYKLFKKDLEFILNNGYSYYSCEYNFKNKSIKKNYKNTKKIRFIILEGIFVEEVLKLISSNNLILIRLKINKKSCMKRVIKRDFIERGKNKKIAEKDFIKAWELFYKNERAKNTRTFSKEIILKNKSDINSLIKRVTNIVN